MDLSSRYEIVDTIASGDFATVYRARDRELGREVAIKQIHQQFLADEQQLARYWQEAQLLASLQHPNILTIYDIVRGRGWLVLELMRGSLQETTAGEPIDLDFLRTALIGCLSGLHFLHTNGVIHGDVKPANLLVDARNQVKLGDFGLARRATGEEGSLLKGTTKYMAPELVSQEFGAVGPGSDLYSLGFSAYELICGSQFESLFPGLGTFGRDKQIAWMMWHAAADRNLPEIGRVLEGVPEDLARVIQKLIVKDQARRYQSARDVLRDLAPAASLGIGPEEEDPAAIAAREAAAKQKRRLRRASILAMSFSVMICLALLWPEKPKQLPSLPPEPTQGVVRDIYPNEREFVLEQAPDGTPKKIRIKPHDRVFINNKAKLLRDLHLGDRVSVKFIRDESGHRIAEIFAFRPEVDKGRIKTVVADEGEFTLTIDEGENQGKELLVSVGGEVKILFNGQETLAGKPVTLADLQTDDRAIVHHLHEETGRTATQLSVKRVTDVKGVIRDVDTKNGSITLTIDSDGDGDPRLLTLPLASDCEVTINDLRFMDQQLLKPADLRSGDEVTVARDTHALRVNAYRVLGDAGVIRRVLFADNMLDVVGNRGGERIAYVVGSKCNITLAGEPVDLEDLRDGDVVDITHDSPGAKNRQAITISARRPPDPTRWAILIANQDYEDASLFRLDYPAADAKLLRDALVKRYRVPADQAHLFTDESLVRLRQGIPERLGKSRDQDSLIVYFAGHAYQDEDGTVYLAPKSFDLSRMESTGLPLQWLLDEFESCSAKEKLLLLDCCHAGDGADLARQPSTAEMLGTLDMPGGMAPLRTVTAVASCAAGQRGLLTAAKDHGLFPSLLAESYSGRADGNRDNRLEPTELFEFLKRSMAAAGAELAGVQTPQLFLGDDRPPRLSEEAKKAIRRLGAFLRQDKVSLDLIDAQYATAEELAGEELEPKLLYGLLLLKNKNREEAISHFAAVRIEHPEFLVPMQGMAWAQFEKRNYKSAVNELRDLVLAIPKPKKKADAYSRRAGRLFYWTGQLREFAAVAAQQARRPSAQVLDELDAAVAEHGSRAVELYEQGRARSLAVATKYDEQLAAVGANTAKLKVDRRQLGHYASFPFEGTLRHILAGLDEPLRSP